MIETYAQKKRYHLAEGMSFIEIMVVLFIIGLIASIGVPLFLNMLPGAQARTTKQTLLNIKSSLDLYYIEHGKYPQKLIDLVEKPKGEAGKKWTQYFQKLPVDAWQNEFYYKPTPGGKHPYELYSYGGQTGSEEPEENRINIWEV